jgi:hypothetical protein
MCGAKGHVRFTPDGDRKSGHSFQPANQLVQSSSASLSKSDMCNATGDDG